MSHKVKVTRQCNLVNFSSLIRLIHNFIRLSLNSGSAQVQILLAACRRFTMARISDNGPGWKKAKRLSSERRTTKTIHHHHDHDHHLHSINWPNFIVWLPLLLEILNNMCITIVCLRQFLATESPLKMMKHAFYFASKAFILKVFKVSKQLD